MLCKSNGWALSTMEVDHYDLTPHIEELAKRIFARRRALDGFLAGHDDASVGICAVSVVGEVSPALTLAPALLRLVADLGATLSFDQDISNLVAGIPSASGASSLPRPRQSPRRTPRAHPSTQAILSSRCSHDCIQDRARN